MRNIYSIHPINVRTYDGITTTKPYNCNRYLGLETCKRWLLKIQMTTTQEQMLDGKDQADLSQDKKVYGLIVQPYVLWKSVRIFSLTHSSYLGMILLASQAQSILGATESTFMMIIQILHSERPWTRANGLSD